MSKNFPIVFIDNQLVEKVLNSGLSSSQKLRIISEICRLNTLSAIKKAGSGHIGTSFSALDMFVYLYFKEMNTVKLGVRHPDRDIFFSSKGHDCPGFYAVLAAAGIIPYKKLHTLRRLGGLDGNQHICIKGVEANTGSLGMGISKGRGMAKAKRIAGCEGRVIVMTGDGELQEGQVWESLQTTVHQKEVNLIVIVDHNKIQSDRWVEEINSLGDLEKKLMAFGWHVERCDGHDFESIEKVFRIFDSVADKPKILIADTIKGHGVSFMEGPRAMSEKGIYRFHSGSPSDEAYIAACDEIFGRIKSLTAAAGFGELKTDVSEQRTVNVSPAPKTERIVETYAEELLALGGLRKDLVVLDADLSDDCGLRPFEYAYPERFIENGISEQDMVSMAGGLALQGFLPIVNSFGAFLAARANEQIYANNTERTKIIYACHYAGLIPAGPGHSHQSLRDIALFGALPHCTILEPCNSQETKALLRWCVESAQQTCLLRMILCPSPGCVPLPENYEVKYGQGTVLKPEGDAAIVASGPILTHEALKAQQLLEKEGIAVKVVTTPWLNVVDRQWMEQALEGCLGVVVLDNHSGFGGLGDCVLNAVNASEQLRGTYIKKLSVDGVPACGTYEEVLKAHGLDADSIVKGIKAMGPSLTKVVK